MLVERRNFPLNNQRQILIKTPYYYMNRSKEIFGFTNDMYIKNSSKNTPSNCYVMKTNKKNTLKLVGHCFPFNEEIRLQWFQLQ